MFLDLSFALLLSFVFKVLRSTIVRKSGGLDEVSASQTVCSIFKRCRRRLVRRCRIFKVSLNCEAKGCRRRGLVRHLRCCGSNSASRRVGKVRCLASRSKRTFQRRILTCVRRECKVSLIGGFAKAARG